MYVAAMFALLLCSGRLPCAEDSFTRQLRQLAPLVAGTHQSQQQQQQEQDVSLHGPGSHHPSRADSSDLRYAQAAYSVASYDDNGTDSAASSPRSRSSWAPSVGSHLPPSRCACLLAACCVSLHCIQQLQLPQHGMSASAVSNC
jgi:hypothetical protein